MVCVKQSSKLLQLAGPPPPNDLGAHQYSRLQIPEPVQSIVWHTIPCIIASLSVSLPNHTCKKHQSRHTDTGNYLHTLCEKTWKANVLVNSRMKQTPKHNYTKVLPLDRGAPEAAHTKIWLSKYQLISVNTCMGKRVWRFIYAYNFYLIHTGRY